jgi:hypothetical protein
MLRPLLLTWALSCSAALVGCGAKDSGDKGPVDDAGRERVMGSWVIDEAPTLALNATRLKRADDDAVTEGKATLLTIDILPEGQRAAARAKWVDDAPEAGRDFRRALLRSEDEARALLAKKEADNLRRIKLTLVLNADQTYVSRTEIDSESQVEGGRWSIAGSAVVLGQKTKDGKPAEAPPEIMTLKDGRLYTTPDKSGRAAVLKRR